MARATMVPILQTANQNLTSPSCITIADRTYGIGDFRIILHAEKEDRYIRIFASFCLFDLHIAPFKNRKHDSRSGISIARSFTPSDTRAEAEDGWIPYIASSFCVYVFQSSHFRHLPLDPHGRIGRRRAAK
jgi:hypothetical protein